MNNYKYYSINYVPIKENYFSIVNKAFNNYITKIKNLKSKNLFYSFPKKILNEIFLERRKKIELLINQYSNKYNYDSIGFTYNIDKDFDFYLQKYYLDFEFNNTYDYFELIENASDIYIHKLLEDSFEIKNLSENRLYLIFDGFLESLNKGSNYVENEFIEEIKINNTKCLNLISDLYLNISLYLNNTNITESEDYIMNNCTKESIIQNLINNSYDDICLNISQLNYPNFFSRNFYAFRLSKK